MAYLGLVPSEHSTGPKRRIGAITKAGDVHARSLLIEAAHSYRFPARVARHKLAAVDAVPEAVRDDVRNGYVSARAAADIYRQPQDDSLW